MPTLFHLLAPAVAAFLASLVEAVEALTVVLAIGHVRGWRWALWGAGAAFATLLVLCLLFGPALTRIPLQVVQIVVGGLLLLFGLRWLRKAILRAAGVLALHDEDAAFSSTEAKMAGPARTAGFDAVAFGAAYQIVMLEGIEVVFIVLAVGAGGAGLMIPAALGALVAVLAVILLGVFVHRPLSRVPENTLKLIVGVMLTAFGTFWIGEGVGIAWPFRDSMLLALAAVFAGAALGLVALAKSRRVAA